jgi:AraC-like DNA-binding protein/cupin superfamily acireductone dioxygenase involved in methionine salvage
MKSPEIEEQNDYRIEDGWTLCREAYKGIEIEQCKRHEPCSMPDYHEHDSYEIYYLLSGTRYYFINDKTYRVDKGDLVLINRGLPHKTTYCDSLMHERILINFDETYIQDIVRLSADVDLLRAFYQNRNIVKLPKVEQTTVERLLFNIIKEARGKDLGYESYVRLALGELLIFINRKAMHTKPSDSIEIDHMHGKVSEIQKYLSTRYMKKITLGSISEKFYISPFYLSRIFKKTTGFTFVEYLNSLRIREAQQLLKESQLNVSEIADRVGYDSQTHFGRVFKKLTGMSPLQYKKMD